MKYKKRTPQSRPKRQIPGILRRDHASRSGLTLIELMFGILIGSILMTGIGSAIYIALQSLEQSSQPASPVADTAEALDQVYGDMNHALRFTERTGSSVTFYVPDRDGNVSPEKIRIAWSGTSGDPLTRSYNNSTPLTVAENVHHFALPSFERAMTGTQSPALVWQTGPEGELISHDDAPGGSFVGFTVDDSNQCAQYFQPILPANAVSWKFTQLYIVAQQGLLQTGSLTVQIRTADANKKPGATVLSEVTISELELPLLWDWKQIPLSTIDNLTPGQGLCVVCKEESGLASSCHIQYEENGTPMTAYTHFMTSADDGTTWSDPNDTQDMRFIVNGTYTTEEAP